MVRIVKNFAVTQSHLRSLEFTLLIRAYICKLLFVFRCFYGHILHRFGRKSQFFIPSSTYGTRTSLSQTDRASATHTIRRGHIRDL